MEKIAFIVERLQMAPFNKTIATMTEIDSKTSIELLELLSEIRIEIDPDQEVLKSEAPEQRVRRILHC